MVNIVYAFQCTVQRVFLRSEPRELQISTTEQSFAVDERLQDLLAPIYHFLVSDGATEVYTARLTTGFNASVKVIIYVATCTSNVYWKAGSASDLVQLLFENKRGN
jgi:hypothetical protein